MKILSIVGARPNFMKIAPFIKAINDHNLFSNSKINHLLVHTGQHYDQNMSDTFFTELGIPQPDINLGIGSGSHAEQVGKTMIELEKVFRKEKPDWVIVVGDVNATLAASVTAKKEHIKCAHIEAGLRSGDMKMPEEINRLVTDRLSDLLLTPDLLSNENLRKEGVPEEKIKFVGNIMIDTLEANRDKASKLSIKKIVDSNSNKSKPHPRACPELAEGSLVPHTNEYALMTLHRPSNVDDQGILSAIIDFLCEEVATKMPLIWPIHPRTEGRLKEFNLWNKVMENDKIILLNPLGYLDMLRLNMDAKIMLTDSGGLQEECTVLGTPCITMRWNTERPVTLQEHGGASVLVGNNVDKARKEFLRMLKEDRKPVIPELWDGKTAERILKEIINY
jgi:UDP-N-acetylglucosamine 2-epimerase (non-hydrolysing)